MSGKSSEPSRMKYKRYSFRFKETITTILARDDRAYRNAVKGMLYARGEIERFITKDLFFLTTLEPYDCEGDVVGRMCYASKIAGVGPMAAVAATIAWLGVEFSDADFIVIDNGGDIVMRLDEPITVGIYAGKLRSIGFEIGECDIKSICTSSGKIGHSISFGFADAATIISENPSVADALATALGNMIKEDYTKSDIENVLESFWKDYRKYIECAIVIKDDIFAFAGDLPEIKRVEINPDIITRG